MLSEIFCKIFHANAKVRLALTEVGLREFQDFMTYSESSLVSRPLKLPVRTLYLSIDGQRRKYFLKKKGPQSLRVVLQAWFRFQRSLSSTARELMLLELMRQEGIPVMSPVAWGEQRILGCLFNGFIIVEEVTGKEFVDVYRGASLRIRRRLFFLYGGLMGALHRKGIDSKVRPQDLICVSDDYTNFQNCFVVIDRERGQPNVVELSTEQCGSRLGDIWVKGMSRIGLGERSELLAFLSGYLTEVGREGVCERGVRGVNLVERASRRAAEVLYRENRFMRLRKGFQMHYGISLKGRA